MESKLPNKYISYSALELWYKNPKQFRQKYYEKKKGFETPYTLFGKEVHDSIDKDTGLDHIPRLSKKEVEFKIKVDDVPIRAYVDTFDEETLKFFEYKTCLISTEEKWDYERVRKHRQLAFYAMLIQAKYGSYNPNTLLITLETEWKENSLNQGTAKILLSKELVLTGKSQIFKHIITDDDVEKVKEWMKEGVRQIIEDYENYKKVYKM